MSKEKKKEHHQPLLYYFFCPNLNFKISVIQRLYLKTQKQKKK
jgi:hypothetical protein